MRATLLATTALAAALACGEREAERPAPAPETTTAAPPATPPPGPAPAPPPGSPGATPPGTAPAPPAATPPGAPPAGAPAAAPASAEAVERGRQAYLSVCTACHHADPNRDGAVGPANAGASRALLEAKILRGEYPPGYTPKRPSNIMPRFPHLEASIPDLAAFLADAKRNPPR